MHSSKVSWHKSETVVRCDIASGADIVKLTEQRRFTFNLMVPGTLVCKVFRKDAHIYSSKLSQSQSDLKAAQNKLLEHEKGTDDRVVALQQKLKAMEQKLSTMRKK